MNAKYIIGGVIVIVAMISGGMAFLENATPYVSIEKAMKTSSVVQVMGKVNFETKNYDVDKSELQFAIYDAEAENMVGATTMNVVFKGVVPGNFDQATQVVLKGKTEGELFVAEEMLVKCPSKYQGEDGAEYQDMQKHNDAVGETGV